VSELQDSDSCHFDVFLYYVTHLSKDVVYLRHCDAVGAQDLLQIVFGQKAILVVVEELKDFLDGFALNHVNVAAEKHHELQVRDADKGVVIWILVGQST